VERLSDTTVKRHGAEPSHAMRNSILNTRNSQLAHHSSFIIHHFVLALVLSAPAYAQRPTTSEAPLSDRRVAYTIDATLDEATRTVRGTQRLRWRNADRVPVSELQFHLYLNAFRDERSTFMIESGGAHRGFAASSEDPWGGIDVDRLERISESDTGRLGGTGNSADAPGGLDARDASVDATSASARTDLTDRIRFIQPDDDNPFDKTVIAVDLDRPVQPGQWVELEFEFTSRLPEIVARTGWTRTEDDNLFVMVAQWFPKIGVREVPGQRYVPADAPEGQWSTHQFHANSEFYADFGTYDVTIRVPERYKVGATGVRVGSESADGTKSVRYLAEDVHDFAWTASPEFLEYTDTWQHVNIRLLIRPEHRRQARRHFDAVKVALEYFDRYLGEYPYTTLTLVDGYGGSNGMEYPTLITCGTYYGLPNWLRFLELVTIHEFGHQYFYGMLASNEAEEAWLDEGMNSYLETRIMDSAYGRGAMIDLPGLPVGSRGTQRLAYTKNRPASGALFTKSWEFAPRDYGKANYAKPATVMNTLERYLGDERMNRFLRDYYETWRFRHPTTRDVQETAERAAGEDLDWFFDQFVYGTAVVDYAVEIDSSGSSVTVRRMADGYFPIDVAVRFDDGSDQTVRWDGIANEHTFDFAGRTVVDAFADMQNVIVLDVNRLNNRATVDGSGLFGRKVQAKVLTWTQQVFYLLQGIL